MPEAEGAGRVDGTHAAGRHGIRARVGEDLQHFLNCRRERELQETTGIAAGAREVIGIDRVKVWRPFSWKGI